MKRNVTSLLMAFSLALGTAASLRAQSLPADRFLEGASARPVGDEMERDQYLDTAQALSTAPAEEVQRVLPSVLQHTQSNNELHVRVYASGFLFTIAQRPDGAKLLSSNASEISSLLSDENQVVQRTSVAITLYVIGRDGTDNQRYVSALEAGMEKAQTPQEESTGMAAVLLGYSPTDRTAVRSVLSFLNRDDLTASTKIATVESLGSIPRLPDEVGQTLCKYLDDPDPKVRAAVVVAAASSPSSFHALAKDRVVRMASDPQENVQVRDLAKKAAAGQTTDLNPNIDTVLEKPNPQ